MCIMDQIPERTPESLVELIGFDPKICVFTYLDMDSDSVSCQIGVFFGYELRLGR